MLFQDAAFAQHLPDFFPVAAEERIPVLRDVFHQLVDLEQEIFPVEEEEVTPCIFIETGHPCHVEKAAGAESFFLSQGRALNIGIGYDMSSWDV